MEPIYLLSLASRKSGCLAARQATVASNISNVNTPGYRAKDLAAFSEVLNKTQMTLASTNVGHITPDNPDAVDEAQSATGNWEVTETGNSVGLEEELMKANTISGDYELTTNIVKSFHAMLMSVVKE
jgi:flagellar basal-body rod protein FlgB